MRGLIVAAPLLIAAAIGLSLPQHRSVATASESGKLIYATGRIAPPPETFLAMAGKEEQQPSQPAAPAAEPELKYATGRVAPTREMYASMVQQTASIPKGIADFPEAKDAKWDSREHGWIGPIVNQLSCGSCWDFSGTNCVEVAFVKAGYGKADQFKLSEQYTLSCYGNGGCNGDDNTVVLKHAKKIGLPLTSDYGPYKANEGPCNKNCTKFHKIDDWALVDGAAGYEKVGSTQKIKNAIKACGSVGVAICADSALMNMRPGSVFRGRNRQINHEVNLVGWDDTKIPGRTVWLMRNSWGKGFADEGYCWIEEGANGVGTQPVVAIVASINPEPEPGPDLLAHPRVRYALIALVVIGVVVGVVFVIRKLKAKS